MAASANIHIDIWSERFLGTQEKGREFLDLIETMDSGMWTPQRWGHFEPIKREYSSGLRDPILSALTEVRGGRTSNHIYLRRKAPSWDISLMVWRSRVPDLNSVCLVL